MTSGRRTGAAAHEQNHQERLNALEPSEAVGHVRDQLESALSAARDIVDKTPDARISGPVSLARELLVQTLSGASATSRPTERLTVALMGRTKAGKSQLVAALTGDQEAAGVGNGRHRTTKVERTTVLESFDLIDLPGVAALGGEDDTSLAIAAAARADAVIWLYAESMQDTEASELEDLLRQGKPVVVAFNAKWSIDSSARRQVFAKTPGLAFRDLDSHQERIQQIASRAGTQAPPFVAVHARAAWFAMREQDPVLRTASRIEDVLQECDSALTTRAEVLRIRARHDRPRHQLVQLGTAAQWIANEIGDRQVYLEAVLDKEAGALGRALLDVHSDALIRLDAVAAGARRGLGKWLKKHRNSDESELNGAWSAYIERAGFTDLIDQYADDIRTEIDRSQTILQAAEFVDNKLHPIKHLSASPDQGPWGRVKSGLRALRRAAASSLRALGVDRGVAILIARIGGRAVPGVGWWLLGVDALQGLSVGAREELAERRIRADRWKTGQAEACVEELAATVQVVGSRLAAANGATRSEIDRRLRGAKEALRSVASLRAGLLSASDQASRATAACDVALVSALLLHDRQDVSVMDVKRVPNEAISVRFVGRADNSRAIASLTAHLAPELVSERSGMLKPRTRKNAKRKGPDDRQRA